VRHDRGRAARDGNRAEQQREARKGRAVARSAVGRRRDRDAGDVPGKLVKVPLRSPAELSLAAQATPSSRTDPVRCALTSLVMTTVVFAQSSE